jgi:allophanate hydrolase subunit 2
MHEGVPPGGALVPELLARANAAAGNAPGEAALEVFGVVTLAAEAPILAAADDASVHLLRAGEPWTVASAGARVRYVAVRGGIDVPRVLGGRGTLVLAALGGLDGRPLRRGDVLPVGAAPGVTGPVPESPETTAPIRVVPGPDLDRFAPDALDLLLASSFAVDPTSDRAGIRLAGPPLPRAGDDTGASTPMVRGALQVPTTGLIALGPDHPTTGGYPVIATIASASFGALAARSPGAQVRFVRWT